MEYFGQYLSICHLGSAAFHMETRTPAKTVSLTSTGLRPLLAGMPSWPRVATASICGLTNAEAGQGAIDYARCASVLIDPFAAELGRWTAIDRSDRQPPWGRMHHGNPLSRIRCVSCCRHRVHRGVVVRSGTPRRYAHAPKRGSCECEYRAPRAREFDIARVVSRASGLTWR